MPIPIPRKVLLGLAAVLALAGLLLAGAWSLAQTRYAADRVARVVEAATGQPVQIDALSVGFGTRLGVRLKGLAIASRRPGAPAALLDIGTLEAELPWRAVIDGQFVVRRLSISHAVAAVDVDAEGRDEWTPMLAHIVEWVGPGESRFDIGRLEVADSSLELRDQRDGTTVRLNGIGLEFEGLRPRTPFDGALRLAGQAGEYAFHASANGRLTIDPDAGRYEAAGLAVKAWLGGGRLPLAGVEAAGDVARLQADLKAGTALVDGLRVETAGVALAGRLQADHLDTAPTLVFDVATREFDPHGTALAVGMDLPALQDVSALRRLRIAAKGSATARLLTAETLDVQLDDTTAHGSLALPLDGTSAPVLRLEADRIDLWRYLPPAEPGAKPGDPAQALEQALAALRELDVDAKVSIDEAQLAGARARRLTLVIEPNARSGPPPR